MRIAVVGGGISGLTAAYRLGREHEVTLFEAGTRLGGNIRTDLVDGSLVEWGPTGFLDNEPATLQLVKELGLEGRMVRARQNAARRFIWRAGRLRELPAGPRQFLFSDCMPLRWRLRALLEPFAKKPPGGDESVHAFAARRLGRGSADLLVDAFVTGVFAGDPKRLSVRSAFPKLAKLEAEYGSLLKGAKGRGMGPAGVLVSFDKGLQVLIDALAERVDVCLNAPWDKLEKRDYDRVVCTVPAPQAAKLVDEPLASELRRIPTAPVAVVAMVFDDGIDVPDVFGFLAPRGQNLRILGTLYDSSIFPGRAPQGMRLFRTMVGGRRDPEAVDLDDEQLTEVVRHDLRKTWGFLPEPRRTIVMRHRLGIAQYELGHADIVERISSRCPDWLTLAGSSYHGVSLNLCVKEAMSF